MGNFITKGFSLLSRFFDYPIKRKPICFYRTEQFKSTGEPKEEMENTEEKHSDAASEYDKMFEQFHYRLATIRKKNRNIQMHKTRWSMDELIQNFPGWNEITVTNLHSLFLLFNKETNGMLGLNDFCSVLECLGDESSYEVRAMKFEEADADGDGWINYDVFLSAIYNFNAPSKKGLGALAKRCHELGQSIKFVTTLSVGEQLEYGLF